MSAVPDGLRYSKDHEWAKVEGDRARVGITDHAQSELTDVVYVELPETGKVVDQGAVLGTVESVKAVSEILSPLGGKVLEVNRTLEDRPEIVNKDPYGGGWLVLLEIANPSEVTKLLDPAGYRKHIGE
ncbi:MAG: glycine cleavage system protein H [Euryarchaeota archaeon RBG_16_67_27]|nr:MAG: glycine cleavage system protein H [Euryarchaeota archaeon RBG_16_67_27]